MLQAFEKMSRPLWFVTKMLLRVILIFFVAINAAQLAHGSGRLSAQQDARQLGLIRAWFAQVRVDPSRYHVERAILVGDRLTVLTSGGIVHEFHALTGETMWVAPIGNSKYPNLGPAASDQFVAVINGSTLYVLDRTDGRPVLVRSISGVPGAAPALARDHVFVPLLNGRIEAYPLHEQKRTPWYYQSYGRAMVPPLVTPHSFVWSTDSGYLYVGRLDDLGVRFRLETGSEIAAPPAYRDPFILVATVTGEVFAVHEMTGARRWKYATGFTVMRAPAAIGERVFVTSEEPALHCIDAKRGIALWEAAKIWQFAAASQARVYGVDELHRLVALDGQNGRTVGRMAIDSETQSLVNDQTDRIYLVSSSGLVQCFHEIDSEQPLYHVSKEPAPAETAPAEKVEQTTVPEVTPQEEEKTDQPAMPPEEPDLGVDEDDPFKF
jgi:outer membrane protein assembly factor BamB